jgi:stage V sporulation protein R
MKDNRIADLEQLAKDNCLDFFPVVFEVVSANTMNNVCAYGLPTRARHWSYGRSYDHQRIYGEMGFSKVFEMITNNDPSYAFVLDSNTEAQNLLIVAHCFGHCLVPGTLVETPLGPRLIETLRPGDKVLAHDGNASTVSATARRRFSGTAVDLKIGSQWLTSTDEHPFRIVRATQCFKKGRKVVCRPTCTRKCKKVGQVDFTHKWVKASDIAAGDFAVFPRPILGSGKISEVVIEGEKGHGHPGGVKKVRYVLPMNKEFGEFLGLYLAEGYAREGGQMGLCFNISETDLHVRSRELVKSLFGLNLYNVIDKETHSCQILFNEKVLANWLMSECGSFCDTKRIPYWMFDSIGPEMAIGLIRGVFNGDGHNGARQLLETTTSASLASQLRQLCLYIGVKATIRSRKRSGKKLSYDVLISGTSHKKCAHMATNDGNRTFEHGWMDTECVYYPIADVRHRQVSDMEVVNLQVPRQASFVLFDGIATHNSDFFKNNTMFKGSDRNMARHAAEHANRIDQYIEQHGLDAVERIMDIAFGLDDHIDVHKGLYRNKYPKRHIEERLVRIGEFDDLLDPSKAKGPSRIREVVNATMPPHPEKDLLWFFIHYAPLEDWERDILDMVREESFYFYPQRLTKVMNEGWAVYWHAELLHQYKNITPEEMIDFARTHEMVVQPGNPFDINPYYLGYRIYKDIEKRWDKMYADGESNITGRQKIFEVRRDEDDISFLRNYLTVDLVQELKLFTFGREFEDEIDEDDDDDGDDEILYEIKSRMREEVVEALVRPRYNNWAPKIVITDASSEKICLRHDNDELGPLNFRYAEHMLEYIWELWAAPVELYVKDDEDKEVVLLFDEAGFSKRFLEEEFGLVDEDEDEDEEKMI